MLNKSANYNTILANPSHKAVSKLRIGNTTYTQANIMALSDSRSLGDYNDIGNFVMGQLDFTMCNVTPTNVPKMSRVEVWTNITDGTNTSNDLPKGIYYTKKPSYDDTIGVLTVTAYDLTYLYEQELIPNGTEVSDWNNKTLREVAQLVATKTGISLDNASDISNTLTMSAPPFGKTCREIMCDIGIACGGNFTLAYSGSVVGSQVAQLRLIKTNVTPVDSTNVGQDATAFEKADALQAITKVIINYGYDSNGATLSKIAGADGGRVLEKTISTITDGTTIQTIANNLLTQMSGVTKVPYKATSAALDPATELGDKVTTNSIVGTLDKCDTTYNQGMWADIESNGQPEEEDFPYMTNAQKVERNVSTYGSKIEVNADKISLVVTGEGANKQVNTAQILLAINGDGTTSTLINADKVKISGTTTFNSLITPGTTTIDGGKITANSLTVTNAEITSLNAGKLTVAGQSIGTAQSAGNRLTNLYTENASASNIYGNKEELNGTNASLKIGYSAGSTNDYVLLEGINATLYHSDGTVSKTNTWYNIINGGGGGEPSAYLKSASVNQAGTTLTLTNKDNTTVTFTPVAVFGE